VKEENQVVLTILKSELGKRAVIVYAFRLFLMGLFIGTSVAYRTQ